ncbi:hypothetical protein [Thiolapillus sp.]|uniref:hypothetical protein n=1 Tax=Thiolapillus sp. TaxID=2017437 RepID=UPI003AF8ECD9
MTKYYVVEVKYWGPNRNDAKHVDLDRYEIMTTPPRIIATGEVCTGGYLGASHKTARYALGAYDSLAAAEYSVETGPLRYQGFRRDSLDEFPYNVLAVYRPGRLPPMSDNALDQWLECSVHITADDGNMGLVRRAAALQFELEEDGYSVTRERMIFALAFRLDRAREERGN